MRRATPALFAGLVLAAGGAAAVEGAPLLELPELVELASPAPVPIALRTTSDAVHFVALHGTVSEPVREGDRLRAQLQPEPGRVPKVAIVAALAADGSLLAWGSIPLHGNAAVTARTKPDAKVQLRVGAREYGPATSDARGETRFEVTIPPGLRVARASAEDRLGATVESDVAIDPPPFARLLAICEPGGTLTVLAVGTGGGPAALDAIDVRAATGYVRPAEPVAPGRWAASYDPTDATADETVLTAEIPGEPASVSSCTMKVAPETPFGMDVSFGAKEYRAGNGSAVPVSVVLRYAGRRSRAAVSPLLDVDFGRVSDVRDAGEGRFEALWTIPDALEGRRKATLHARAADITDEGHLAVRPGPANRIEARLPELPPRADGRTTAEIPVRAYDEFGNVAAGPLDASAESGSAEGIRGGDGVARYIPPVLHRRGSDVLRLRADGTELTLPIVLRPIPRTFSVGVRGGWTTNLGRVSAPRGTIDVTTRLPLLGDRVGVGLEAGWLPFRTTLHAPGESVDVSVTAVPVLARASADLLRGPADLFAGAAAGAMVARTATSSASTGRAETVEPSFVAGAFAGGSWRFQHASVGVELWYRHARVETPTLDGSLGGPGADLFYRWEF